MVKHFWGTIRSFNSIRTI
ncbi:rCG59699 [Rattus norvegicus]|uniref:RCG59699 n=1 Tax=Rattus norvegicus TaxID=10116 RepID=A6HRE8_RAT|nr:rCG59699 [Rattus norvegicus]